MNEQAVFDRVLDVLQVAGTVAIAYFARSVQVEMLKLEMRLNERIDELRGAVVGKDEIQHDRKRIERLENLAWKGGSR